jgi:hypothetical protein
MPNFALIPEGFLQPLLFYFDRTGFGKWIWGLSDREDKIRGQETLKGVEEYRFLY